MLSVAYKTPYSALHSLVHSPCHWSPCPDCCPCRPHPYAPISGSLSSGGLFPQIPQPLLPPLPFGLGTNVSLWKNPAGTLLKAELWLLPPSRPPGRPDLLTIRFFTVFITPDVLDIYLFATSVSSHTQVLLHEVRNSAFFTAASPGTITAPGINEHAMSTCWADVNELLWNWRQRAPSTQRWVSQNSPAFVPAPLG